MAGSRAIPGWAAAEVVLDKVNLTARRELFALLLADSGVRTAPGLTYMAERLRWHADEAHPPVPPSGRLSAAEIAFVEQAARRAILPFDEDRRLCPRHRRKGFNDGR